MNTIPADAIDLYGICVVDRPLARGPVHVTRGNRSRYVVLSVEKYDSLMREFEDARLAASEADLAAGRVRTGTARQIMHEILGKDARP